MRARCRMLLPATKSPAVLTFRSRVQFHKQGLDVRAFGLGFLLK